MRKIVVSDYIKKNLYGDAVVWLSFENGWTLSLIYKGTDTYQAGAWKNADSETIDFGLLCERSEIALLFDLIAGEP